jgi:hypothetical protein
MEAYLNKCKYDLKLIVDAKNNIDLLTILFNNLKDADNFERLIIETAFKEVIGNIFFSSQTYLFMKRLLSNKSVLSIGSGVGFIESILKSHGIDIIATDIVPNKKYCVQKLSSVEAVKGYNDYKTLLAIFPIYISNDKYKIDKNYNIDENKLVSPSVCANCTRVNIVRPKSQKLKKPRGWKKMGIKSKEEYRKAEINKQNYEWERKNTIDENAKLCICCTFKKSLSDDYVWEALKIFKGETFIHVGEHENGCTGSPRMWCELQKNWDLKETYDHPNWKGYYSCIQVYTRKLNK